MGRRNDHSRDQIRDMALDAALNIVEEGGIQALSARKIAGQIGYTVGTLYLVFSNLDDLVMQVNLRTLHAMRNALLEASDESQPPAERIKSIAHAYVEFAHRNEHPWRMIYEYPIQDSAAIPEAYQDIVASLFQYVEAIMKEGGLADNHDIATHTRALWGSVYGICSLSLAGKLEQNCDCSPSTLTDALVGRFVAGSTT